MRKLQISFDWLNYKDKDEMAWAIHYLTKAGWGNFDQSDLSNKDILNGISSEINLNFQFHPEAIILLLKRMKGAKSARDCRNTKKKQHKKNYSFVMDKSIQGKLKHLAGEQPLSQTLEHIINDVAQFKKQLEAQLRESIKPSTVRVPSLVTQNSDAEKIKKLNILKKCQEAVFEEVLRDLCKYEHIFEKMHYTPFIVTDDYKAIESKFQKRKTIINKQIKDKLGFFRFNLKASQFDVFGDVTAKTDDEKNNDSVNNSV